MNHLVLIPAALVALQAVAASPIKLPITQKNHASWMKSLVNQKPGEKAIAILSQDVTEGDRIVASRGSRLLGMVAKDGSGSTFTRIVLPNGDQTGIEAFTLKGLLKEGE